MPGFDFSDTPLSRKLGLRDGMAVHTMGAPAGLISWLDPMPTGVRFVRRADQATDLVLFFTDSSAELAHQLAKLKGALKPQAALWVCWPKQESKVPTDIHASLIGQMALPLGWMDFKLCSIHGIWSGLCLVTRKQPPTSPRQS